ncbi:sensor histidine kinase [Ostreiculturibacter nitratireducens]|uniref:sensor histidine kinase n=1 Tax=Ostreiculturibacter nitratireducens TaxID=3075226 RepID=UPI0031B5AC9D
MTLTSKIDVKMPEHRPSAGVVLGEDWVAPESTVDMELRAERERRRFVSVNRSPLARKLVTFNLLAIVVLVAGVLYLNPFRSNLVYLRETALATKVQLAASAYQRQLATEAQASVGIARELPKGLLELELPEGSAFYLFNVDGRIVGTVRGRAEVLQTVDGGTAPDLRPTPIVSFLDDVWSSLVALLTGPQAATSSALDARVQAARLFAGAKDGATKVETGRTHSGDTLISAATPVLRDGQVVGVLALSTWAPEIDLLVRTEREQVLQIGLIAAVVSIAFSLLLASTISNPLSDLATAAELGRDRNARKISPGRVRIPDLTARPDEIGRLSAAMRGMVAALYDRIDANEQFAADVAHEIKNPLASLRSAVGTMRVAKRDDQREKLLAVIEHDVRRLDRLVSDISNASRLDSELVKEEEESFDLLKMLSNIVEYQTEEARAKGVDFIADLPQQPIMILGLEARLAQVFVNIISNAISFCEAGDAVRVWARQRENRVLVVVEDTGPGIPEQALTKVFKRFYSERPVGQFGNHSGLGLAISKQIVEAHGGVIWAENIRPTNADITSEPLGARFVVGLPL